MRGLHSLKTTHGRVYRRGFVGKQHNKPVEKVVQPTETKVGGELSNRLAGLSLRPRNNIRFIV